MDTSKFKRGRLVSFEALRSHIFEGCIWYDEHDILLIHTKFTRVLNRSSGRPVVSVSSNAFGLVFRSGCG
jgi:hypothetical protein